MTDTESCSQRWARRLYQPTGMGVPGSKPRKFCTRTRTGRFSTSVVSPVTSKANVHTEGVGMALGRASPKGISVRVTWSGVSTAPAGKSMVIRPFELTAVPPAIRMVDTTGSAGTRNTSSTRG